MSTVLDRIVADKRLWVEAQKNRVPLSTFQSHIPLSDRDFDAALHQPRSVFILECKKASPSKGLIREDFDLEAIANVYRQYANAISVLTDEVYFQGDFAYLKTVANLTTQPVLCKDFFIDEYQVHWARHHGAHAILLMLSVLSDDEYQKLATLAHQYKMGVLTEVSTEDELQRAINLKAKVVGINNRDLRDLSIDLNRTKTFAPKLPKGTVVISESGIHHHQQIKDLSQYADGFLIGSALMAEDNLDMAVRRVLLGENKVCGLTQRQDAQSAYQFGAVYGGVIFVSNSPRCVSLQQAQEICKGAPLCYVGVFQNTDLETVITYASTLNLFAVQLHGEESTQYIETLRQALPTSCQIWKAHKVTQESPTPMDSPFVDKTLFDSQHGGSGTPFDWALIDDTHKAKALLAGGLTPENLPLAIHQEFAGVDLNSGVESQAGIKDHEKLKRAFYAIRQYGRKCHEPT